MECPPTAEWFYSALMPAARITLAHTSVYSAMNLPNSAGELGGVNLMEGGIPIVFNGKIVGGIHVSGVDSKDDTQIAQAGADAVT